MNQNPITPIEASAHPLDNPSTQELGASAVSAETILVAPSISKHGLERPDSTLVENSIPIPTQKEIGRRHYGRRMTAALLAGTILVTSACETPLSKSNDEIVTSQSGIDKYAIWGTSEMSVDAKDPVFRAAAVSVLVGGGKIGSASLLKTADGTVDIVTAEHVARPYSNMPSTVQDSGVGISISEGPQTASDNRFYVPGVGLLKTTSKPNFMDSSGKVSTGNGVDLFADYTLTSNQQKLLQEAESKGTIKIPERSTVQPHLGDLLTMPSAENGKNISLLYLYTTPIGSGNATQTYNLVPLVVLDQGMNVQQGQSRLDAAITAQKEAFLAQEKQQAAKGVIDENPGEQYFVYEAVQTLITEFEANKDYIYSNSAAAKKKASELSDLMPCDGDSGSPLLDSQGNTLGVLSSGTPFNVEGLDGFSRHNNGSEACLSTVNFDSVPKN